LTPEENRRRFERQLRSLVARIKLSEFDDSSWDIVTIQEISANGILFSCGRDKVKQGMRMQLKLNFPASAQPLDMNIAVVRVERRQNNANSDFIGAEFVQIRNEDRLIIDNFVRETKRVNEQRNKPK